MRNQSAGGLALLSEAELASVHPGHTVEEVRAQTGWEVKVAAGCGETAAPGEAELEQIRRLDPDGFWTGRRE